MLVRSTFSIAELVGTAAPLVPGGAVALDHSGALLAVEVAGTRILVADAPHGVVRTRIDAEVTPPCALAVHAGASLVAVGAADGRIVLHDISTGQVCAKISMDTATLTALAFSVNGRLLAAGDDGGHVVVFRAASGEEVRKIDTGSQIRALAVAGSGSPVLIGDAAGRVIVRRRVRPPLELAGKDSPVTSLAFAPYAGEALAGRADGTIGRSGTVDWGFTPHLEAGTGPVRALVAGPRGHVMALDADGQLNSWTREREIPGAARNPAHLVDRFADQLLSWWQELRPLISGFADVRERMRTNIGAGRAEMLDRLDGLDDETRDRIRPVVVESALSIFDSYAFDLAVRKIFRVNPLPRLIRGFLVLFLMAAAGARWLLRSLRAPSALAQRRKVLGAALLHALLDVAYQAQLLAEDNDLAASPQERQYLFRHVQLAARIASREWVSALHTGSKQADRVIRDQGRVITAAIRRWEREAALAGALLPPLSKAAATAVVNAADNDWQALGGDPATKPVRHRSRALALVRQMLALAVPLGATAGIMLGIRPLPTALVPLLTFLVGLAIARVLRWLDFDGDIEPALKISELLRKPQ